MKPLSGGLSNQYHRKYGPRDRFFVFHDDHHRINLELKQTVDLFSVIDMLKNW